jgi:microcystin-dependent protein
MAALRKWGDDISGAIVTSGTSTAYTVSSKSNYDTLAHLDGQLIAFTPHTANGATVTLSVDGLTAKPLRPAPDIELQSNSLIEGTPYFALYNNTDGVFYLHGASGAAYGIPLAGGLDYWGSTTPSSAFAFPIGQAISRTTYATLFSLVGTAYGSGDGSTTFNLPDRRGRVSMQLDPSGSIVTSTTMTPDGNTLGAKGGEQVHTLSTGEMPQHSHGVNDSGHSHGYSFRMGTSAGSSGTFPEASTADNNTFNGTTASSTTGISIQNAGSSSAHNNVQPTIACNYIMRII